MSNTELLTTLIDLVEFGKSEHEGESITISSPAYAKALLVLMTERYPKELAKIFIERET